jgi:hypothetical protein
VLKNYFGNTGIDEHLCTYYAGLRGAVHHSAINGDAMFGRLNYGVLLSV